MQMAHEQFSIQIPRHPSLSFPLIFKSAQILYHDLLEVHRIVMSFQEQSVQRDAFPVPLTLHCSWKSFLSGGRKILSLTFLRAGKCLEGSFADCHLSYLSQAHVAVTPLIQSGKYRYQTSGNCPKSHSQSAASRHSSKGLRSLPHVQCVLPPLSRTRWSSQNQSQGFL